MRRKLSWAVLGASGVLVVAVVAVISTSEQEAASRKIIVPTVEDVVIDLSPPATTGPSKVFIDAPPVAVISETVAPAPPAQPTVVAVPKKASPPRLPGPAINLALGKPISASGSHSEYPPKNATDGNVSTYWESTNNALPQTITIDLGAPTTFNRITLKLPPSTAWGARTQTLTITGGSETGSYSTLVASRGYTFDQTSGNTASASFGTTTQRFVRLAITANTGWPAGQISEFEVAAA